MASVLSSNPKPSTDLNALKVAVAIALLRSKELRQQSSSSVSDADAQRWKRKAKERKRELVILREELKQLEESGREVQHDVFPQIMSCRCHFFDGCGALNSEQVSSGGGGGCDHWIDDVMRRRFLRHVRWTKRQRRQEGSIRKRDCIVSLKKLLSLKKDDEVIEEIVNSLITRLLQRMCRVSGKDGSSASGSNRQLYVQHLIRKLGNEPFVGQRAMLLVSQRISSLADSLAVTDPFDDTFPDMHDCMFMMIQLTEFMMSDNLQIWTTNGNLDSKLFEEWLRSLLQARKALGFLENRNGLYLIYLERTIGEVANQVGPLSNEGKLDLDLLSSLFC